MNRPIPSRFRNDSPLRCLPSFFMAHGWHRFDFPRPLNRLLQTSQLTIFCGLPVGFPLCSIVWHLVHNVRLFSTLYLNFGIKAELMA